MTNDIQSIINNHISSHIDNAVSSKFKTAELTEEQIKLQSIENALIELTMLVTMPTM